MAFETLLLPKHEHPPEAPWEDHLPVAQPISVAAAPGLVSIIVSCCAQLEYTMLCMPSILRHTGGNHELIFLDIGSLDGTAQYLAGIAAAAQVRVEIVRTRTDLGIPTAVQSVLMQARGEYIVLLNNDTIVTDGWLKSLVALANISPAIGLVGPMSNCASPPQLVENVPYRIGPTKSMRRDTKEHRPWFVDAGSVDAFAYKWRETHKGKWKQADSLGGFCVLLKRAVLDRIGCLDQASELGVFDYPLLSRKAREAGFTLACCRDLYIHHFGTGTFAHGAPWQRISAEEGAHSLAF
jgi:GT2 family glycosyltransferase